MITCSSLSTIAVTSMYTSSIDAFSMVACKNGTYHCQTGVSASIKNVPQHWHGIQDDVDHDAAVGMLAEHIPVAQPCSALPGFLCRPACSAPGMLSAWCGPLCPPHLLLQRSMNPLLPLISVSAVRGIYHLGSSISASLFRPHSTALDASSTSTLLQRHT